jgi:hypothetical protein
MKREDDLVRQLQSWGFHQVNRYGRYAANDDRREAADHPIERARDFAPMTRENVAKQLLGRDGRSRRRLMAKGLYDAERDVQILDIVPMWACDPMPARNDAGPPRGVNHSAIDIGTPEDLRWIDRALAEMSRSAPVRALVLREEYCGQGTHSEKAAAVENQYGGNISVRQYRYELGRALDWMRGRRAA